MFKNIEKKQIPNVSINCQINANLNFDQKFPFFFSKVSPTVPGQSTFLRAVRVLVTTKKEEVNSCNCISTANCNQCKTTQTTTTTISKKGNSCQIQISRARGHSPRGSYFKFKTSTPERMHSFAELVQVCVRVCEFLIGCAHDDARVWLSLCVRFCCRTFFSVCKRG